MKHFYKVLMLLMFLINNISAQHAFIKGMVIDKQTNMPLHDVFVYIDKTGSHAHTDDSGRFVIINLPHGKYNLEIDKTEYQKQVVTIDLSEDSATVTIQLASKSVNLGEVAVETDRPVSAASSSYISQSSFSNRPKNSAQDLLRLVPGLFIAQHAGGGKAEQIFIRGFDCDHGTDIATFVDGMPVNMPSHGHGQGYADLHFLTPEVVEGMSVFKGTSAPQYGDFATGAAVSFKTYDSLPNNLIQLEAGSVPQVKNITSTRGLAMLKIPFNSDRISSYFVADVISNRGFFNIDQKFNRVNLFSKTTYYINDNSKLQITVSGFGSSWNASGQIPERAVAEGLITRYGSIDPNEGGTTQRNNYNLVYSTKLGTGDFETQAYMSTYRFKLFSDFTFFLQDTVHGDMIEQDDNRKVYGLNTKYSVGHRLFSMQNKFTLGASFREDEIENQLWHAPQRVRMEEQAHALIHERSNSIYFNEVFRVSKHFRAEVGLRYDYFIFDVEDYLPTDSTHKNYTGYNYQTAFNPKFNLIYTATDKLQFFFNAGSGYHSNDARAVVQDKYRHNLPRAVSAEIGTLFYIKRVAVSAALWAMDLNNELVYSGDDGTTHNRGSSRRYGVDVSVRAPLTKWFFVDADLNYSKSRYINTLFGTQLKTDYYIPLAPTLTSAGGITTKFKNFEFSFRYRYMHDRPASSDGTIVAHGYTVFDFTANYKVKRYKIGLVIENLFNTKWNEAQFETESRLKEETKPIDELNFTPGTPFYIKLMVGYLF